ncbi:branched-chain alpha-ketoacid dehydrogenase [Sporodiniella umbellata]|nr:branched-chain alpha-ketoacid dehydrogenase [Sporodiniella umbellata]
MLLLKNTTRLSFMSLHRLKKTINYPICTKSGLKQSHELSIKPIQCNSSLHFYQNKIIDEYATQPVNPSTIRQFIFFGRQMNSERLIALANWVRKELLVRLAHRVRDFQQLPFIVGANPHIEHVYSFHWTAFEMIRDFPPITTEKDNSDFCRLLSGLLENGLMSLPKLATGISESAAYYSPEHNDLDLFLTRTLRSRVSRRVLVEQHLALTEACNDEWDSSLNHGYVGIIFMHCSAQQIIKRAKSLAYRHIKRYQKNSKCKKLGAPEIEVTIHSSGQDNGNEVVFAYVPEQLEHILYEILDNSIRFTMKKYPEGNYPSIKVNVSANETDVYFRVSDNGGGMTKSQYERLWSYQARAKVGDFEDIKGVEKIPANIDERANQASKMGNRHFGLGLTMSRVYAEYWGGELQVIPMNGFGTDVYVRIPRLGTGIENVGIDLHSHPAFHQNDSSQLILKKTEYTPKNEYSTTENQLIQYREESLIQNKPVDAALPSKLLKGSSWSDSLMIQS